MSYNNRSDNFAVTSGRDGSRVFRGNSNYRFTQGSTYRGRGNGGSRGTRRPSYRNVSASSSRFGNRYVRRGEDDEGDVSMSGDSRGRGGRRPYRSNRGRINSRGRGFSRGGGSKPFERSADQWYKVAIPFGTCISEKDLYALISSNIEEAFDPVQYGTEDKRAFFYVKGTDTAESIRAISRRLTKPDGRKLVFHVAESSVSMNQNLSEAKVEKLKLRMSDRYDPATQLLDMSSFYSDTVLAAEGTHLALNRRETMTALSKIVAEHIPELSGLNLKDNRLYSLGDMGGLVKGAPNVVSLNLSNNQLKSVDDLAPLKGWTNVAELVLDGNNFCSSFRDQNTYVSAVRKLFPKVVRLDGTELPPPITFDLDTEEVKLPESKGSYFVNEDIKNLVVTFIKEYYTIFDSDRRRDLLPAYHENAMFSVCTSSNPMFDKQVMFNNFFEGSRNLKRMGHYDQDKLAKKVHSGNLRVITHLESMPKTTHDTNSFKVDVGIASPKLLNFVLHGVFKENDGRSEKLIRTFSRSFVTIPSGSGMVITNDMLMISNAGFEQRRKAFSVDAPTPSPSPVPGPATTVAASPDLPALTPEQMQMVSKFVTDSRMNSHYSLKCLQENGWDYQRAGQVFTELHKQGGIPADAFAKDAP